MSQNEYFLFQAKSAAILFDKNIQNITIKLKKKNQANVKNTAIRNDLILAFAQSGIHSMTRNIKSSLHKLFNITKTHSDR